MNLRILAVDDEPEVLLMVKAMVEPLGMQVLTSGDSREAAERAKSEVFDGFLIDAKMPDMDGFQLAECIRNSPANSKVPVAMLTGYDDVETMRKGFHAGVTFFLGKPFTRERACSLFSAMRGIILREKRQHARLPYRTEVTCKAGGFGEKVCKAESVNIGEGGMLLQPSGGFEAGQEIRLEFSMPGCAKRLRPRAKVLRREPPDRIAVQFIDIEIEEQEAVRNYIFGRSDER